MYKFQSAPHTQVVLTSLFDWRRTVQKMSFLRYPQRLINPRRAFLIMCPTILSCINGHISHSRDLFTGLYFSFVTFAEPFIISIRLCSFCMVLASGIFLCHPLPPNFSQNRSPSRRGPANYDRTRPRKCLKRLWLWPFMNPHTYFGKIKLKYSYIC